MPIVRMNLAQVKPVSKKRLAEITKWPEPETYLQDDGLDEEFWKHAEIIPKKLRKEGIYSHTPPDLSNMKTLYIVGFYESV